MNRCGAVVDVVALDVAETGGGIGVANNGGGNGDNDASDTGGGVGRGIEFVAGDSGAVLVLMNKTKQIRNVV